MTDQKAIKAGDSGRLEKPEGSRVEYRPDAKLLIVIGGISAGPNLRGISYFVWEQYGLKRIRFAHRRYAAAKQL